MIISKDPVDDGEPIINNVHLQRKEKIIYLGTINDKWDYTIEIKCRIEKVRASLMRLQNRFT